MECLLVVLSSGQSCSIVGGPRCCATTDGGACAASLGSCDSQVGFDDEDSVCCGARSPVTRGSAARVPLLGPTVSLSLSTSSSVVLRFCEVIVDSLDECLLSPMYSALIP